MREVFQTENQWWAGAHPAPAVLGHGIHADPNIFERGRVGKTEGGAGGLGNKPV